MTQRLQDGEIRVEGTWREEARYDVSNSVMMAGFDGRGNILHYSRAGIGNVLRPGSFYSGFTVDGVKVPATAVKNILMIGRRQSILVPGIFSIDQCMDQDHDCLVYRIQLAPGMNSLVWTFGYILDVNNLPFHIFHKGGDLRLREIEGAGYHWSLDYRTDVTISDATANVFWMSFGAETSPDCQAIHESCLEYEHELLSYLDTDNELHRALFVSALNVGISAWKQCPGADKDQPGLFEGFFAGIDYQTPARTYYRDAYWTIQPLLHIRPDWIRREILTLARGIDADLECPSGVQSDGKPFWPKHGDSPLYFILMVADYLEATGESNFLATEVKGASLATWMQALITSAGKKADHTGLLVRPKLDRHDWADNVFRTGYVSYMEILWWRALDRMHTLFPHDGYGARSEALCTAINAFMWDDQKGYYINYFDGYHRETNLSLDTVMALLWGLVPAGRKNRFVAELARHLESRNNPDQGFGDWGVMCVWPPYAHADDLVEKSMYDFSYHNGSEWPWLSALYALALKSQGLPYEYPLTRWFVHGIEQGWYTPVEYHSPVCGRGSLLQAWSALAAAAFI